MFKALLATQSEKTDKVHGREGGTIKILRKNISFFIVIFAVLSKTSVSIKLLRREEKEEKQCNSIELESVDKYMNKTSNNNDGS